MMDTSQLLELYKSLFETWRFEVNSHWQRSSYFAAFETVAVAGCWKVLTDSPSHSWAGMWLAVLGMLLTAVWIFNNNKTHEYARYWLNAVGTIEQKLGERTCESGIDFAAQVPNRPRNNSIYIKHPHLVQAPPFIFLIAWGVLLLMGVQSKMIAPSTMQHAITYESASLVLGIGSLVLSLLAVLVAKSSLSQAKQVADRDQRDWKQRKWADMYLKVNDVYDALDRFRVLSSTWDANAWGTRVERPHAFDTGSARHGCRFSQESCYRLFPVVHRRVRSKKNCFRGGLVESV